MSEDEKFMQRCFQLALNGKGYTQSNPIVGAVLVCDGKIIGEGFHREYGKAHAEVNAINSVKDKNLLSKSTIYVSLEPCSHYGKTPPCSQLIIDSKIPRVVIAALDSYYKVSGRGVKMLQDAGISVEIGVLEKEARLLNKEFFTAQIKGRPYVYLKWAQTKDGFIDKKREIGNPVEPTLISNDLTRLLVHKLRSDVVAIMVGTNTALNDNPSLTTRLWYGQNPVRVVLDRNGRIPKEYTLFDNKVRTIIFTEKVESVAERGNVSFVPLIFNDTMISTMLKELNDRKINSLLVEGGAMLLQSFINEGSWDEACVEISDTSFFEGLKAPKIEGSILKNERVMSSQTLRLENVENYKIL